MMNFTKVPFCYSLTMTKKDENTFVLSIFKEENDTETLVGNLARGSYEHVVRFQGSLKSAFELGYEQARKDMSKFIYNLPSSVHDKVPCEDILRITGGGLPKKQQR